MIEELAKVTDTTKHSAAGRMFLNEEYSFIVLGGEKPCYTLLVSCDHYRRRFCCKVITLWPIAPTNGEVLVDWEDIGR